MTDWQRFLLEASRELASSLDFEETLRRASWMLVPTLCDGCAVYVSEDGQAARRVEVVNVDPAREALARELVAIHAARADLRHGVARVMQSGRSEVAFEITDDLLVASAIDSEHLRVLRALGMRSSMIVPLKVRDRIVGALSLVTDASGRVFGPADLAVAEDFALRTAVAVDNSLLYREAQRAAARAEEEARRRQELIATLERTNAELDAFAYVASHDLKAPLRNIATLAGWVEEDLGDAMSDEVRGHLAMMQRRVKRLEDLVEGVLSYSRAGREGLAAEEVDVGALLADVVELLAPTEGATVAVRPGMPRLRTARVPLQQVFMNLIGNALKHGGRPPEPARVTVSVRDDGERWEFAVADEGTGIAPRFHDRVWGMFQTLRPRDVVEGTGIGLAVVRKVVTANGGSAWLESDEGQGACFRFTWPKG